MPKKKRKLTKEAAERKKRRDKIAKEVSKKGVLGEDKKKKTRKSPYQ